MRALALAALLAGCQAEVIDLGRDVDATVDAPPLPIDAAACVCRIAPCRDATDCTRIGGACGPDFFCVGAFGSCATDGECQATVTDSVCTTSATAVDRCGS